MAILDSFFPEQPSYMTGLLGEDEALKARQQAQQAGLLNTGLGLLMASGPSTQRQGLGQILAQGIMTGQQAYQGAYDKRLQDAITAMKVNEMKAQMTERTAQKQALKAALPTVTTPAQYSVPEGQTALDDQGMPTYGTVQTAPAKTTVGAFDPEIYKSYALTLGVNPKDIESTIKSMTPTRTKLGQGDVLVEEGTGKVVARGEMKPEKVDTGNGTAFIDPTTYKMVGFIPKQKDGEAAAGPLRTSFLNQAKPYIEISQAYRKVDTAPDSAAGDISLIFGYMKILDPGSVVREGEFATAQNAAGIPDRVKAAYNKALEGTRLTANQRNDFKSTAYTLIKSQEEQFNQLGTFYSNIAIKQGANPQDVIYNPFEGLKERKVEVKGGSTQTVPGAAEALGLPQGVVVRKKERP